MRHFYRYIPQCGQALATEPLTEPVGLLSLRPAGGDVPEGQSGLPQPLTNMTTLCDKSRLGARKKAGLEQLHVLDVHAFSTNQTAGLANQFDELANSAFSDSLSWSIAQPAPSSTTVSQKSSTSPTCSPSAASWHRNPSSRIGGCDLHGIKKSPTVCQSVRVRFTSHPASSRRCANSCRIWELSSKRTM